MNRKFERCRFKNNQNGRLCKAKSNEKKLNDL